MSSPDPVHDIDAAVAQLTHKCRRRTGLKLSPSACDKRKSQRQKIFAGKSYPIFEECAGCPGPIPLDESAAPPESNSEPPKPAQRPAKKDRKKYIKPTVCRTCGRAPSAEVRFYYSRPDECIECIKRRTAERRANEKKTWRHLPVEETRKAEEEKAKYQCEIHGPHTGRMFGKQHSSVCPKCHSLKMSEKMREIRSREKARPDAAPLAEITLPDWITAWAEEQGAEQGIPGKEIVVGLIGKSIPSDWLKNWLIRQATKEA